VVGLATVFGAGGGTSSYQEIEDTNVIVLWGSNAREAHPIFFHHILKGVHNGAKLFVVDPRRTASAQWADLWLGNNVGTDVALSNTIAREIIHAGLAHTDFIARGTSGFEEYAASVEGWTLQRGSDVTGVPVDAIVEIAHSFAKAGRAQMCWTLGITEHHNGVDNVLSLINLALLCGHVGRWGSGLNPLRGQNNVQGACDMGSFPHELPGYRHVSDDKTRAQFEKVWGVKLDNEPGLRIPNMFDASIDGSFKGLYIQGEDIAQSDPDTQHVTHALEGLECMVVQDIFLNETAKFAHVFLPGSSFLEKNGTFTNAERRISRVRKVMPPLAGKEDWEVTAALSKALGYPMDYKHPSEIMDEIAALTPTFSGVSYDRIDELESIQWPCNDEAPEGTPVMHVEEFVRGKGRFVVTEYVPTEERTTGKYPLILTTGRILSQYNVGAQTRRTANNMWHDEDRLEIHPHDAEQRGVKDDDWVGVISRAGDTVMRAKITERMQPGVVYTTFHFPESGANVITTDNSDWATNCPEYKVTAVQVSLVSQPSTWQKHFREFTETQLDLLPQHETSKA